MTTALLPQPETDYSILIQQLKEAGFEVRSSGFADAPTMVYGNLDHAAKLVTTAARAIEIADEAMVELLQAHAIPIDGDRFGLVGSNCEEVSALADADPAIVEAFEWLQGRGLVELVKDGQGEYIRLIEIARVA